MCALLALLLLAAPALAQGYKLDFIDEQGVYLEALTTQWKEDKLRFDVVVENDTGRAIDLRIEDAYADGTEIDGVGIYDVEDGERDDDEFFFLQPLDGDSMAVLENADVLSFTIEVQDEESHDTLFAVPVTLNVVNLPRRHARLPHGRGAHLRAGDVAHTARGRLRRVAVRGRRHAAHARDGGKHLPGAGGGGL